MSQPVETPHAVPVGTVIAWYPPPNTSLPPGFVYCNGEVINDPDSPFNGMPAPNLPAAGSVALVYIMRIK
jgi:hypothetical protein